MTAGTKLGSYEILAPIGAGAMGEVYRAFDLKLGREVAITRHAEKMPQLLLDDLREQRRTR